MFIHTNFVSIRFVLETSIPKIGNKIQCWKLVTDILFQQEEDGTEVILITKEYYYQTSYVTNATKYKERIKMDPDNTLRISPILVIDNGKKFICSIAEHPGRTMKSITEVKVFGKKGTT